MSSTHLQLSFVTFFSLLIILITSLAILKPGLPYGHDSYAHATYSKLFINALSEGQLPVRWVEHIWIGFGQPLFNYYQVGFYYLVALINFLGGDLLTSLKLSVLLVWLIGTLFVFLFAKKYGNYCALLAATIYIFSPYLVLDIFVRTSYPELMALSFIPGVLWSLDQILYSDKDKFIYILALLLAIVIISHLPTLIIFTPILIIYCLLIIYQFQVKLEQLFSTLIGVGLGVGLSAFYWMPAILEINQIAIQKMQLGFYDYQKHFVDGMKISTYIWGYGGYWWEQSRLIWMGLSQFLVVTITVICLSLKNLRKNLAKLSIFFWLLVICYSLFFMLPISVIVWENLPFLKFVQFPWRFFMVVPLSIAILSAIIVNQWNYRYQIGLFVLIFIINFLTVVPILAPKTLVQADYFNLSFVAWEKDPIARYVAHLEPGYSPKGAVTPIFKDQYQTIWHTDGNLQITEQISKTHHHKFFITTNTEANLQIRIPYAPGWKAFLNNKELQIVKTDDGFMSFTLPPGPQTLEIRYTNTPIRTFANGITLFSIGVILLLVLVPLINFVWSNLKQLLARNLALSLMRKSDS